MQFEAALEQKIRNVCGKVLNMTAKHVTAQ